MGRRRIVVALALVVASCASSPDLAYYTLDTTRSAGARAEPELTVERFVVAERLNSSRIFIRTSPVRITSYASARWAAGLGELVQSKLAAELGSSAAGKPELVVSGRVLAFEQVEASTGSRALVRLAVEIRDADAERFDTALHAEVYEAIRAMNDDSVESLVLALSRALDDIAVRIAEDAESL
jgi:uncharacterized lipoprotein YmbA